jgi:hypothetical protein
MKQFALGFLMLSLFLALPVGAQGSATLPDSFAFDYSLQLSVEGLDTFAISTDLSGSGAVDRGAPAFEVTLQGETTLGTTSPVPVDEALRWVDDTLYLNTGEGWQAREGAVDYTSELIEHYTEIDADPAALGAWNLSGIDTGVSAVFSLLSAADAASYLSVEQLADEGETAHSQTRLDLYALMQTDAFVDAIAALAVSQGSMLIMFERAELADLLRANSEMFAGAMATLDQYVGLSDNVLHHVTLNVDLPIDPTKGGYPNAPFNVALSLDMTLSSQNQPQSITAPDGAQPVEAFTFPAPPLLEAPAEGRTQYIIFSQVDDGQTVGYVFKAEAGDVVTVTVSGLDWTFDSVLKLVSPTGDTLAENDDHEEPSFALGDYQSQIVDFEVSESGDYSAAVHDLDYAAGNFVLSITIQR